MNNAKLEVTRDQLIGVCRNLGLQEPELKYLHHLWNQKQEEVTKTIESLLKNESVFQKRILVDHESENDCQNEKKYLIGYDSLQKLVFIGDHPYGNYLKSVSLNEFVTERYEILNPEIEFCEREEEDLPEFLCF